MLGTSPGFSYSHWARDRDERFRAAISQKTHFKTFFTMEVDITEDI